MLVPFLQVNPPRPACMVCSLALGVASCAVAAPLRLAAAAPLELPATLPSNWALASMLWCPCPAAACPGD